MNLFNKLSFPGMIKNLVYAIVTALFYGMAMAILGRFDVQFLAGYLIIGISFSFFCQGGERLWYASIRTMLPKQTSGLVLITRIPFWYLSGAIGYVSAILFSKKFGLLFVEEIPIKDFFHAGGMIGCGLQSIIYTWEMKLKRTEQALSVHIHNII